MKHLNEELQRINELMGNSATEKNQIDESGRAVVSRLLSLVGKSSDDIAKSGDDIARIANKSSATNFTKYGFNSLDDAVVAAKNSGNLKAYNAIVSNSSAAYQNIALKFGKNVFDDYVRTLDDILKNPQKYGLIENITNIGQGTRARVLKAIVDKGSKVTDDALRAGQRVADDAAMVLVKSVDDMSVNISKITKPNVKKVADEVFDDYVVISSKLGNTAKPNQKLLVQSLDNSVDVIKNSKLTWQDWVVIGGALGIGGVVLYNWLGDNTDVLLPNTPPLPDILPPIVTLPPVTSGSTGSEEATGTTTNNYYEGELCTRVLKRGSRGDDVKDLQQRLNDILGSALTIDGIYGSKTENAVKMFQKNKGITVDGMFGPESCNMLNKKEDTKPTIITTPEEKQDIINQTPEVKDIPEEDVIPVEVEVNAPQSEADKEVQKKCPSGKEPVLVRRKNKFVNRRNKTKQKDVLVYRCRKI